jgi:putative redox protein
LSAPLAWDTAPRMDKRVAHAVAESETGYAQKIRSGRHELAADEPQSGGGTDTGPNPYTLLLASLGACTSITLRMYAQRKGWELGAVRVELDFHKDGDTDRIERQIRFSAPLSAEQRQKLAEIAEKTPVTKTIKQGAGIETRIHPGGV